MKKAYSHTSIFIYILTLVIVALIFSYSYTSLKNILQVDSDLQIAQFKNKLREDIDTIGKDYGSAFIREYQIHSSVSQVCFYKGTMHYCSVPENISPMIIDFIALETGNNVFIHVGQGVEAIYAGKIQLAGTDCIYCIKPENSRIKIMLSGMGDRTLIQSPDDILEKIPYTEESLAEEIAHAEELYSETSSDDIDSIIEELLEIDW